jgi:heme-degrading monooxygenase HmoA
MASATVAVLHSVNDYEAWKQVFDEHGENRQQYGCTGHRVYRRGDNGLEILVLTDWPSLGAAHAWAADPSLRDAMQRAGVNSAPRIEFFEEAEVVEGATA